MFAKAPCQLFVGHIRAFEFSLEEPTRPICPFVFTRYEVHETTINDYELPYTVIFSLTRATEISIFGVITSDMQFCPNTSSCQQRPGRSP